jgi:hypothetical protein
LNYEPEEVIALDDEQVLAAVPTVRAAAQRGSSSTS